MRVWFGSVLLSQLIVSTPASAQGPGPGREGAWRVGLTVGTSTFNGAATGTDESGAGLVFRPYRPTMLGLGFTYGRERIRFGFSARYGQPGLGFRGVPDDEDDTGSGGVLIVAENAFHLVSFAASAGTRLVRLRGGPVLRSSVGVAVDRWMASGTPTRTRIGPQAGLTLEFNLTDSLFGIIDGELGFMPSSPFLPGDLPEGFHLRSMWRRTLQAGLSLRL